MNTINTFNPFKITIVAGLEKPSTYLIKFLDLESALDKAFPNHIFKDTSKNFKIISRLPFKIILNPPKSNEWEIIFNDTNKAKTGSGEPLKAEYGTAFADFSNVYPNTPMSYSFRKNLQFGYFVSIFCKVRLIEKNGSQITLEFY